MKKILSIIFKTSHITDCFIEVKSIENGYIYSSNFRYPSDVYLDDKEQLRQEIYKQVDALISTLK